MNEASIHSQNCQEKISTGLSRFIRQLLTNDLLKEYFDSDKPDRNELTAIFYNDDILAGDKRLQQTLKKAVEQRRKENEKENLFSLNKIENCKESYPTQWMKNDKRIWENLNSSKAKHFCTIMNALDAYKWKSAPCRNYYDWPIIVEIPYKFLKEQHGLSYQVINAYLRELIHHNLIKCIKGGNRYNKKLHILGYWSDSGKEERKTKFPYKKYLLKNTKKIRESIREFDAYRYKR